MSGEGFWQVGNHLNDDYFGFNPINFQHNHSRIRRDNFQHHYHQPQIFRNRQIQKSKVRKNNPNALPASKAHLVVAIRLQPISELKKDEAEQIKSDLQEKILETALAPTSSGNIPFAPAFRGNPFLSAGVLKLWCENDQALTWLRRTVAGMRCPRSGCKLRVISQRTLPKKIKASLFIPDFKGKLGALQKLVAAQNSFYKINTWALLKATSRQARSGQMGVQLALGIPIDQIPHIMKRDRRVSYLAGSIYMRFYSRNGLSDNPPFDWESLQCDEKPKVETNLPNNSAQNISAKLSSDEIIVIDNENSPVVIKEEPTDADVTILE